VTIVDEINRLRGEREALVARQRARQDELGQAHARKSQVERAISEEIRAAEIAQRDPDLGALEAELRELEAEIGTPATPGAPRSEALPAGIRPRPAKKGKAELRVEAYEQAISAKTREIVEAVENGRAELVAIAREQSRTLTERRARVAKELRELATHEQHTRQAWANAWDGRRPEQADDPLWQSVRSGDDLAALTVAAGNMGVDARITGEGVQDLLRLSSEPVHVGAVELNGRDRSGRRLVSVIADVASYLENHTADPRGLLAELPPDQGEAGVYERTTTGARVQVGARTARKHRAQLTPYRFGFCLYRRVADLPSDYIEPIGVFDALQQDGGIYVEGVTDSMGHRAPVDLEQVRQRQEVDAEADAIVEMVRAFEDEGAWAWDAVGEEIRRARRLDGGR
jgi:hypothetical protein